MIRVNPPGGPHAYQFFNQKPTISPYSTLKVQTVNYNNLTDLSNSTTSNIVTDTVVDSEDENIPTSLVDSDGQTADSSLPTNISNDLPDEVWDFATGFQRTSAANVKLVTRIPAYETKKR